MDIKLLSGALGAEVQGADLKDSSEKNLPSRQLMDKNGKLYPWFN